MEDDTTQGKSKGEGIVNPKFNIVSLRVLLIGF